MCGITNAVDESRLRWYCTYLEPKGNAVKIDNSIKSPGSVVSETKTRSTREASSSSSTESGSTVQLSSLASHLQQLEQTIADTPVVDSGKVEEIKTAISQGQFKVNPEKVADGLLDSVRQMLAAQPRIA